MSTPEPYMKEAGNNGDSSLSRSYAGTGRLFGAIKQSDAVFAVLFIFTVVFFFVSMRYGIQSADESFYLTIPYRLFQGDRLIADEWHLSQLSALFQYLPLWLFIKVTGGTSGLILFFRQIYVVLSLILFAYIYFSFRSYGFWGVGAAVVFTGYHSFGYCTLNYYVMSNSALLIVLLLLFSRGRRSPGALIFTGFIFACCVLIEPVTAVIYFLYCVLLLLRAVFSRRKKSFLQEYSFILDTRIWLFMTVGIVICAVIFFVVLLAGADFGELTRNFSQLFTDSEYNWFTGTALFIKWHKVLVYMMYCGYVPAVLNGLFILSLIIFRKKIRSHRAVFFASACLITAVGFIAVMINPHEDTGLAASVSRPVIWMLFGFACYILTVNKNKKMFVFLQTGALFTLFTDFLSEVSVGGGSIVSAVPAVILFAEAFGEVKNELVAADSGRFKLRKFVNAALSVSLVVTVFCECYNYTLIRTWHLVEDLFVGDDSSLDTEITVGPLKGLNTTASIAEKYNDAISDMDVIREQFNGPLYVADLCPWYYIYSGLPIGAYSTFYVPVDSELRLTRYWQMHTDNLPECIYVPFFNCDEYAPLTDIDEKFTFLRSVCDFDVSDGKAGYILTVREWHLPTEEVEIHAVIPHLP